MRLKIKCNYGRDVLNMKEYQNLIGSIIIAIAIVIASVIIAQAVEGNGNNIFSGLHSIGTLIRDGLLQIGSES